MDICCDFLYFFIYLNYFMFERLFNFCNVYLFLERGEGREKERERNIDVWEKHPSFASHTSPNWGPGLQPRLVRPDWELNQLPLGSQASAQSTEPYQPGHFKFKYMLEKVVNLEVYMLKSTPWTALIGGNPYDLFTQIQSENCLSNSMT